MSPSERIIQYVLDRSEGEPIERRAQIYRDLSTLVADDAAAAKLVILAEGLEATAKAYRQLRLDLGEDGGAVS